MVTVSENQLCSVMVDVSVSQLCLVTVPESESHLCSPYQRVSYGDCIRESVMLS